VLEGGAMRASQIWIGCMKVIGPVLCEVLSEARGLVLVTQLRSLHICNLDLFFALQCW